METFRDFLKFINYFGNVVRCKIWRRDEFKHIKHFREMTARDPQKKVFNQIWKMKAEKLSRFTYFRWVNFYWATLLDILHVCQQSTQSSYLSLISNYIRGEKNCHVEKLQLSIQNLNNLWSFIDVSAVFVLNLGRQKSGQRKSVWRKNDKYEVCVDTLLS